MTSTVYLLVTAITFLVFMVAVFVYDYTTGEVSLNEGILPKALVTLSISACWILVVPLAVLVGTAYGVAKLLIFCWEKWSKGK